MGTLRTFAGNDRQLQGTPGAIAVLQPDTRRLDHHPHVHLLMPAAVLDGTRKRWRAKRPGKVPAGAQFRLPASELQAADRLAAFVVQLRAGVGAGVGEAARADHLHLLRSGNGNRADADSIGVSGSEPTDRCGCVLIT